jgi:hypothetical protein
VQSPVALLERTLRVGAELGERLRLHLEREAVLALAHREEEADRVAPVVELDGRLVERRNTPVVAVVEGPQRVHLAVGHSAHPFRDLRRLPVGAHHEPRPQLPPLTGGVGRDDPDAAAVLLDQPLRARPRQQLSAGRNRVLLEQGVQDAPPGSETEAARRRDGGLEQAVLDVRANPRQLLEAGREQVVEYAGPGQVRDAERMDIVRRERVARELLAVEQQDATALTGKQDAKTRACDARAHDAAPSSPSRTSGLSPAAAT